MQFQSSIKVRGVFLRPSDIIKADGPVTSIFFLPSSVKMPVKPTLGNTIGAVFLGLIGCALYVLFFMECLLLIPISIVFSEPLQSKSSLIIPISRMTGGVKKLLCVSPFSYHKQVHLNLFLFIEGWHDHVWFPFSTLLGSRTIEACVTMLVGDWL